MENEVASAIRNGSKWSDSMIASALDSNYWKSGRAGRSMIRVQPLRFLNRNQKNFGDVAMTVDPSNSTGVILSPINFQHKAGDGVATRKRRITEMVPSLQAKPGHTQGSYLLKNTKVRRLTPTECERLQGFPDGWTEGVSDTQRYKLLGNAVTVNVIRFLGEKLGNILC